jgi:hypothetical protein
MEPEDEDDDSSLIFIHTKVTRLAQRAVRVDSDNVLISLQARVHYILTKMGLYD